MKLYEFSGLVWILGPRILYCFSDIFSSYWCTGQCVIRYVISRVITIISLGSRNIITIAFV